MKGLIIRILVLLALGVAEYTLHRPWRLFVLVLMMLYGVEWTAFRHRRTAIHLVRQRRHRLANQLQLVTGWLQLGATAKAEEALEQLMEAESSQSLWFRGMPSHWIYLFLRWDARGEERGVLIHWAGLDRLIPGYRMAWILDRRLAQAMMMAETKIVVQFLGNRFRIRVPEYRGKRLRGWTEWSDGVECYWGSAGRLPASTNGSSESF